MAFETQNNYNIHSSDGVVVTFPYSFPLYSVEALTVQLQNKTSGATVTVSPSSYQVTGIGEAVGGSVTFLTGAPITGFWVVLIREVPYTQPLDLINQSGFFPASVEGQLDLTVMQIQQLANQVGRSLKVPLTETGVELPRLADRVNGFLAFDADGNAIISSGTGTDTGLRTDLATNGPPLISAPNGEGNLEDYLTAWVSNTLAGVSYQYTSDNTLTSGGSVVGKDLNVTLSPAFTDPTVFVFSDNSAVSGLVVDGSNAPDPTANWGAGRQVGGGGFGTGVGVNDRLSHITFGGRWENFPNGVFNFEYVDDVYSPGAFFEGNQTAYNGGAGFVTCADVTGYYGRRWNVGVLVNKDYGFKAHNMSYMDNSHFAGFITEGGLVGWACNQWTGGRGVHVGFNIHDGGASTGHGEKVAGTKQFFHGPSISYNANEGMQVYGGHAKYSEIDSELHVTSAINLDAYQSRDIDNNAELDFGVGRVRSVGRAYVGGLTQNGAVIRGDNTRLSSFTGNGVTVAFVVGTSPTGFVWNVVVAGNLVAYIDGVKQTGGAIGNGIASVVGNTVTLVAAPANNTRVVIMDATRITPIRRLIFEGTTEISNGYSGFYEVQTPFSWIDYVYIQHIRARNLAAGGYICFFKARDIEIMSGDFDNTIKQGYVFYTDAMNRGGTLRILNQRLDVSSSWTSEPFIRLGYSGTGQFSEAGWAAIELANFVINGNSDATFKTISLHGHRVQALKHIVIKDIYGINCALAEQIYIDLSGHAANTVVLDILDVHIFNAAGTPATININDPNGAVYAGSIRTSCVFTGTGRPNLVWPKKLTNTQDLSALAAGATSGVLTTAVTGIVAGDRIDVEPGNVNVVVLEKWVSSAGNMSFVVKNRTAGVLSVAEPFTIIQYRKDV